ncbi:MAG: hypothetical protein MJ001_04625 [Paludibacteraceae bacterium]|nr:hypothetical protein [Paludibacteraceae bacterium]
MKKFFMMLPLMVALVAFVGCSKTTDDEVDGENLKENDPYYESFKIAGCGIFGEPEFIAGTTEQVETSEGPLDVQLAWSDFYAWDGNLNFNENTQAFEGKGFLISGRVPVKFVTTAGYEGAYINPENGWRVESSSSSKPQEGVMEPGVIDPATFGDWVNYQKFDGEEPDQDKIWKKTHGTLFSQSNIPEQMEEYLYGMFRGYINRMVISDGETFAWAADVNMSNMTGDQRCYGFHYNPETNTMTKPYNFRTVNRTFNQALLNAPQKAPAVNRVISTNDLRKAYPAVKK